MEERKLFILKNICLKVEMCEDEWHLLAFLSFQELDTSNEIKIFLIQSFLKVENCPLRF